MNLEIPEKIDPKYTEANPDLAGFDLAAMAGLGAYYDGSGGGVKQLAWEMEKLREAQERVDRLRAFVHKYPLILARLSWSVDVETLAPEKLPGKDYHGLVCEVTISSRTYDKRRVEAREIAALWPGAPWRRSLPCYSHKEDEVRDYTAVVDGVLVRITEAERMPPPEKVSRFGPCGPVRIPNTNPSNPSQNQPS